MLRYALLLMTSLWGCLLYSQFSVCQIDSSTTWEHWQPQTETWGSQTVARLCYRKPKQLSWATFEVRSGHSRGSFRRRYQYDAQDRVVAVVHERWNDEGLSWQPYRRERMQYPEAGVHTRFIEVWEAGLAGWRTTRRITHTFDAQGHLLGEAHYRIDAAAGTQPVWQTTRRYVGDTLVEVIDWRGEGPAWRPTQRTQRSYGAQGRMREELIERWAGGAGRWINERVTQYRYQAEAPQTVQEGLRWERGAWQLRSRRSQTENEDGEVVAICYQRWDEAGRLVPAQRWTYEQQRSRWTQQHWLTETSYRVQPDGREVPQQRIMREYRQPGQLSHLTYWRWHPEAQGWQLTYRVQRMQEATYGDDTTEVWTTFAWQPQTETWLPLSRREHDIIRPMPATASWQPQVFPNPTRHRLQVDTHGWAMPYCSVVLTTLSGQQVRQYQGPTPPQPLTIGLDGLTPGLYLLHVQAGDRQGSTRVWVE